MLPDFLIVGRLHLDFAVIVVSMCVQGREGEDDAPGYIGTSFLSYDLKAI